MSEVPAFIRQGNVNRASVKGQKRPLSIIAENDSDVTDIKDYTKYQDNAECTGKENTFSNDTLESNRIIKDGDVTSNVTETQKAPNCPTSVSENNTSSKSPYVTSINQLIGIQSTTPTSTYLISKSASNLPELNVSFLDAGFGDQSIVLPDFKGHKSLNESCSKQELEKTNFWDMADTETQNAKISSYSQFSENFQNETSASKDATQIDSFVSRPLVDVQSFERIRDTAERLQLPSQYSPTSTFPSSTVINTKFGQLLWPQTSISRNIHELKNPLGLSYQQLSSNVGSPLLVSLALASSPDSDDVTDSINSNQFFSDFSDNNSFSQSQTNRPSVFSTAKYKPSKLSAYFSRRMSNESTGSLSESDLSDGDIGSEDNHPGYLSHFRRLKEMTDKLSLSTRRPSIMLWRQQYLESQHIPRSRSNQNRDVCDERLTSDRKQRIDKALEWVRNQLQEMRSQDQNLAKQLLVIRHDIHKLKLQRSTEEHQELIDDFQSELEDIQKFSDVLDLPLPEYGNNPLKHIGVTRLHFNARRFSAC